MEELKERLNQLKGKEALLKKQLKETKRKLKEIRLDILYTQEAHEILKIAALDTQQQIEYKISKMVSMALNMVFDDVYEFDIHFDSESQKIKCFLNFKYGDYLVHPFNQSGLGASDIAAFALRIISLELSKQNRKILILDEPFKHLKGEEENIRAIKLMKKISEKTGIQIITVSDERAAREDIITYADKTFLVEKLNKTSKVKELKNGEHNL